MSLKRFISILLTMATCTHNMSAGEPLKSHGRYHERQIQWYEFQNYYKITPSSLSFLYDRPSSWIGFSALLKKGHLHDMQNSDEMLGGRVETESFLRFDDSGWTLHGSFEYENGYEKGGSSLLSHHFKKNGTPSFYLCIKPAVRWNYRKYGVSATAVKDLGTSWKLGLLADYVGYQHFRMNDVRNSQTELNMHLALTASLRLAGESWLSFGPFFSRNKEKPSFSTIYSSGPDYQVFLCNGMGTYIKDMMENIYWNELLPGGVLQWNHKRGKLKSLLSYDAGYGSNGWKNSASQASSAQARRTHYHFLRQRGRILEKIVAEGSVWEVGGCFSYTSGKGSSWERSNARYVDNYRYVGSSADLSVDWTGNIPIFRNVRLVMAWQSDNRIDKNYNYRYLYSSVLASLSVGLDWQIGKLPFYAMLKGGCNVPVMVDHRPGAADTGKNIFTEYVGRPDSFWKQVRQASAGLLVQMEISIDGNSLEIGICADSDYYAGGPSAFSGQYYLQSNLFFNVYF